MANVLSMRRCTPMSCAMVIAAATLFWILLRQVISTTTSEAKPAHQFVDFRQISADSLPKLNDSKVPADVDKRVLNVNNTDPKISLNETAKLIVAKEKILDKAVPKVAANPKKAPPQKKG